MPLVDGGEGAWCGRVVIEDPPWRVRLDARHDHRDIINELRGSRSFAPTHVGRRIARSNERARGAALAAGERRDDGTG